MKARRLSDEQKARFWKALRENEATYQQMRPSHKAVASDLSLKLGFDIADNSVEHAVRIGILAPWEPRNHANAQGGGVMGRRLKTLEAVVRKLCQELNVPFPDVDEPAPP